MSMQTPVPQQARILVIDDEPDLRTLYELTLLREGYRVEAAGDLSQARQQLSENRFDAVITDMRLPDGLGLELLRDMVNQQRPERCVVITAHGSAENAVEALKAGAFDYLTKPVDLKQFRSVVASAVQGARPSAPAAAPAPAAKAGRALPDTGIAPLALAPAPAAEAPPILKKLVGEGAILKAFNRDILDVCFKAAMETYAELSQKSPAFKKIYDHQQAFKKDSYLWAQVAEYSYDTFMMMQQRAGTL